MADSGQKDNPYNVCIFRSSSECEECPLRTWLDCKFSLIKMLRFVLAFLLVVITGSIGLLVNGLLTEFYIFLATLVSFSILFFEFWEIKILCSHCPFYVQRGEFFDAMVIMEV